MGAFFEAERLKVRIRHKRCTKALIKTVLLYVVWPLLGIACGIELSGKVLALINSNANRGLISSGSCQPNEYKLSW